MQTFVLERPKSKTADSGQPGSGGETGAPGGRQPGKGEDKQVFDAPVSEVRQVVGQDAKTVIEKEPETSPVRDYLNKKSFAQVSGEPLFRNYENLWRKCERKDGKAFEREVVRHPSMSARILKIFNERLERQRQNKVHHVTRVKLGLEYLINLQDAVPASEAVEPSPFMELLINNLRIRLFDYLREQGLLRKGYGGAAGMIDPKHLCFYSTLDTALDNEGIDFVFKIRGDAFEDGKPRLLMVDITCKPLKVKEEEIAKKDRKFNVAILSMRQFSKSGEFEDRENRKIANEPEFLVELCNAGGGTAKERDLRRFYGQYAFGQQRVLQLADSAADELIERIKSGEKAGKPVIYTLGTLGGIGAAESISVRAG